MVDVGRTCRIGLRSGSKHLVALGLAWLACAGMRQGCLSFLRTL